MSIDYDHYSSLKEFEDASQVHLLEYTKGVRDRIRTWLQIGNENLWIGHAYDPPFTARSFKVFDHVEDLVQYILHGNWCLGQAFVFGTICFINQVDGGDEWLTIKGQTAFESITMQSWRESRSQAETQLLQTIIDIQNATEAQCKRLEYGSAYELCTSAEYEIREEGKEEMISAGRARPAVVLSYTAESSNGDDTEECEHVLQTREQEILAVMKNRTALYVLSSNQNGDVLLEYFRTYRRDALQEATIVASDILVTLGHEFWKISPVDQLQRLLPYLRYTADDDLEREKANTLDALAALYD